MFKCIFIGGSKHLNSLETDYFNKMFYFPVLNDIQYREITMDGCMETLEYKKERYDFTHEIKSKDDTYCMYYYYGIMIH